MLRQGLEGISPKKFTPVTTIPGVETYKIADRVKTGWDQGGLNRVWISDITYLRTGEGWLYLAAVTDAHSRRILGWAMDSPMGTFLVAKALKMAHTLRGEVPEGVVFHADRGSEFTSDDMFTVCRDLEILPSVGRSGVCWDNAMAERVWATLKTKVLRPEEVAYPGAGQVEGRRLDRVPVQPSATALRAGLCCAGRVRDESAQQTCC